MGNACVAQPIGLHTCQSGSNSQPKGNSLLPNGINRPALLLDEYGLAYAELVAVANGFASWETLVDSLKKREIGYRTQPKVALLANAGSLPLEEFILRHTIAPFTRAFAPSSRHQRFRDSRSSERLALRQLRNRLYFCEACGYEDREFWGRSYWRRSHQIPGIEWCTKHECALRVCSMKLLWREPLDCLDDSLAITDEPLPIPNSTVGKYLEITSFILEQCHPISMTELQSLVRTRLSIRSLAGNDIGVWRLLSELAVEHCPTNWLYRLFPSIPEKTPNGYFEPIDNAALCGSLALQESCVLALALVYGDVVQCANDLNLSKDRRSDKLQTTCGRLPPGFWQSKAGIDLYLRYRGRECSIANFLRVKQSEVSCSLRESGVTPGKLLLEPSLRIALSEFYSGKCITSIAACHAISVAALKELHRFNLLAIQSSTALDES